MPGLVPGIHVVAPMHQSSIENSGSRSGLVTCSTVARWPDVDGRDKPGHDAERAAATLRQPRFR
jgi:hypothetical protein